MKLSEESWEDSSLMRKCALMLIMFYKYEPRVSPLELKFILEPILWTFPAEDLLQIRKDWEFIQQKVNAGKAHELSEGDTLYLAAARKGSGGSSEKLRNQPNSLEKAKSRAFALKVKYVNQIVSQHVNYVKILETPEEKVDGLEAVTVRRIQRYIGKSVEEVAKELSFRQALGRSKSYYRTLALRMLGSESREILEFEKAEIELKVLRVNQKGMPKESISFPHFKYMEIINESWENSDFGQRLEKRFLFFVFQFDESDTLVFRGVKFWNMPFEDREIARQVWAETKLRIRNHQAEDLPKSIESRVAHVRPHARNKADVLPTPQGAMLTKKSFWLNQRYIGFQIESLLRKAL